MRTSLRVVGATCAAVLVLPACTSSTADPGDDESETVVPAVTASPSSTDHPTASPSDTASPEDPFAVPDPVTEEYVDRVVNTLYEEWGAITRELLEQPADPSAITPVETRERIAALFGGQYLQRRFGEADGVVRGDRDGLVPAEAQGQLRFESRRIFVGSAECIVVAGDLATTETAVQPETTLVALSLSLSTANVKSPLVANEGPHLAG